MVENRFKKLREDYEFKKGGKKLSAKELSEKFLEKGYSSLTHGAIRKLETDQRQLKNIDEIKAYAEFFNVTADYLLGIRNNAVVDENIAMIGKATGFSDTSINELKKCNIMQRNILDRLISTGLMPELLDAFIDYAPIIGDPSINNDDLSFQEYKILKKVEHLLKEIFADTEFCKKVTEYRKKRIFNRYAQYTEKPQKPDF